MPSFDPHASAPPPSTQLAEVAEVTRLAAELVACVRRPWTLMEVCGGQTHAILRWGLDQLLPQGLRLIHGPGCPVCVTPAATLEAALALARRPGVILCSFGDMLRVPAASGDDLLGARAAGADVRLLTAPLQALELARRHPDQQVVLLAVGFETTAPATALLLRQARDLGITNLAVLPAHVRVVPAMEAILADPANTVQGFLAAGHVAAVMGTAELATLVRRQRRPVVVAGFGPVELLRGLLACVSMLEAGTAELVNAYPEVVRAGGNPAARELLEEVFLPVDAPWRGFGVIAGGGLGLRPAYARFAASLPEPTNPPASAGPAAVCIAGRILQGRALPADCPAFGSACTPERPLGAPMVSAEGACAAYHRYRA
jgi:hydrogenase expression/formation protein HypD